MLRTSLMIVCVALSACAAINLASRLKPGIASEQDVIAALGKPVNVWPNDDGSKTLDYTTQPNGQTSFFVTLKANGKVDKVESQLAPDRLEKIQPGMKPQEVLQLMGKPGVQEHLRYTTTEIWTWYALNDNRQTGDRFQVRFTDGVVLGSAMVWRVADDSCIEASCTD